MLNFPNNPSGYTPTKTEAGAITEILYRSAEKGNNIIALIDDAYFGLVYEDGIATESIFASLAGLHKKILAVKIDGPTKEDYVWGFRVGFITYGIRGGTGELYSSLESKTAGAIRGNISNASNLSQSLLLSAYSSSGYATQKMNKFKIMKQRYDIIKETLKENKYKEFFTALPFNSGYFMCIKLKNLDAETLRLHLLDKYGVGLISVGKSDLRVAFSCLDEKDIQELFDIVLQGANDLN